MTRNRNRPSPQAWAELRFSVIAGLLASPPPRGQLQNELKRLASKRWLHPVTGEWVTFGVSTIERWFYKAREAQEPQKVLTRQVRQDRGLMRSMSAALLAALYQQYKDHKRWSYKLHADNLAALAKLKPKLGTCPSYSTICRCMKSRGWLPKRLPRNPTPGQRKAFERLEEREVRSFERQHAHALWHYDFHEGSLRVVDADGEWHTPVLFGLLDDCSRYCCHAQWYLVENTENLVHGKTQAILKHGLPREEMHDNGGAMRAAENLNGLKWLGVEPRPTLAYSPWQNGKQESFWNQIEGRVLPMLENCSELSLDFLNHATLAWVAQEYNVTRHDELGCSPMERLLDRPSVGRVAPDMATLRIAFCAEEHRTLRRSDRTVSIKGVRFELPSRLDTLARPLVRFRRWDLSQAWVLCDRTQDVLAHIRPVDKAKNADGRRRTVEPSTSWPPETGELDSDPVAPLMRQYLAEYAATGLPPAYLPKDEILLSTPASTKDENE